MSETDGWAAAEPEHPTVKFKRLPHGQGLPLPTYATAGAAGMDVPFSGRVVGLERIQADVVLRPGERLLLGIGYSLQLPPGFEAQVRPRSGMAFHDGITVLNSPGTIDGDFTGEVCVLLINHGKEPLVLMRSCRLAQLVIAPVARATVLEVEELSDTARGEGGFGSTGVR